MKIAHISQLNDFCFVHWGNVLHGGELQIEAKNSNAEILRVCSLYQIM